MSSHRRLLILAGLTAALLVCGGPAGAYEFTRDLQAGDTGKDVKALQVRIAGFYPTRDPESFSIDGTFGGQTEAALKNFQRRHELEQTAVADASVFELLNALQDADGSTEHFDYSEFEQNFNSSCSARANASAGSFAGGPIGKRLVKRNVKRLMWRLEAVRMKGGSRPVGINSGYRSVAYNDCIGGARASQHMYGTAADNRMAEVSNRRERNLARWSQISGIGCYSNKTHNHFDLRVENTKLSSSRAFWWPEVDKQGRHLDETGRPCWGEVRTARTPLRTTAMVLREVHTAAPGAGSLIASVAEIEAFEEAGEVADLGGLD
ncbi:MAG: D-Ala-D-Ala carboxypeptidase family metallohydrolase [Actinomycetota bacterium]